MASEVERAALEYDYVELAKAEPKSNPITGQHVELTVQPAANHELDSASFKLFLSKQPFDHMMPKRIRIASVNVGYRFKRQ